MNSLFCLTLLFSSFCQFCFGQYNFEQEANNSYVIWAYRPWQEDAYLYGGYFYGYSYASSADRPPNWQAGDEEVDVYARLDHTTNKIYMIDKDADGYYVIKRINPFCTDNTTNLWCEEDILYNCNTSQTVCQQEAISSWFQALAFDSYSRLLYWVGRPSSSYNYGFYAFNVDTLNGPTFNDWGNSSITKELANAEIYNGYLWVCEKLHDGLVRYDLNDGTREIIIGLNDYDIGNAVWQNLGAFTFDDSTGLLYFSVHDNLGNVPAKIFSRQWNQTSILPYTQYDIGNVLPIQIRGMTVNPGIELFYITDDQDHTQTITKLILNVEYPPVPRAELLPTSSQYIAKSIDIIPGTRLDYNPYYPNDVENYQNYYSDNPQSWYDGAARLIWMEFNGAFYNAAIRVAKNLDYGSDFISDQVNLWERGGVTAQRFSSIYVDLINQRIWIIDPQEQYQRIRYLSFDDNFVHDFFTCPYPEWFVLNTCNLMFPVCNSDTCSLYVDAEIIGPNSGPGMMYFTSQGRNYYWNMTYYYNKDPRHFPQEFSFSDYVYFSGKLEVIGDYLYLAASQYGIIRKDLSTIGVDSSSDIIVNKGDFYNATIKCYAYDKENKVFYICANDDIYYYTNFDESNQPMVGDITLSSSINLNLPKGSSYVWSGSIIYSVDVSNGNGGGTLFMQYKYGSDLYMFNYPTPFETSCSDTECGAVKDYLYSTGSGTNPQTFTFYIPGNESSTFTMNTPEGSNVDSSSTFTMNTPEGSNVDSSSSLVIKFEINNNIVLFVSSYFIVGLLC